jgi:ribosomal protein L24E
MKLESPSPSLSSASATIGLDRPLKIACPFVYANGRVCKGHVDRVEVYKAKMTWSSDADGTWSFDFRHDSHYHLFCSEKGNHAGSRRQDPKKMKFWLDELQPSLQMVIKQTKPN